MLEQEDPFVRELSRVGSEGLYFQRIKIACIHQQKHQIALSLGFVLIGHHQEMESQFSIRNQLSINTRATDIWIAYKNV